MLLAITNSISASGQQKKVRSISDSAAVIETTNQFVKDFVNLDWEKFKSYFADDATAFFPPSAKFSTRANNKIEIEKIFSTFFENVRKQKSGPPYLDIKPAELRIQLVGTIAIVSFVLNDPGLLGRRTIIWTKRKNGWKIIHLHASGIPNL